MTNSLVFTTDTEGNFAKLCCIFHVVADTPCVKTNVESELSCHVAVKAPPLSWSNVKVLVAEPVTVALNIEAL